MPIPLVERSESYIAHRIRRRVGSLSDVASCAEVSIGYTRKKPSIRLEVQLRGNPTHEETHMICSVIENKVRHVVPNAHVDINSQCTRMDGAGLVWSVVKNLAEKEPGCRGAQNIHLSGVGGGLGVDFLLIAGTGVTGRLLGPAEAQLEKKLRAAEPRVVEVVMHSETLPELIACEMSGSGREARSLIEHVVKGFPEVKLLRPPVIRKLGNQTSVGVRVAFTGIGGPESARKGISDLEDAIRSAFPAIARVDVVESRVHGSLTASSRMNSPV